MGSETEIGCVPVEGTLGATRSPLIARAAAAGAVPSRAMARRSTDNVRGFGLVMLGASLLCAWKLRLHGVTAIVAVVGAGLVLALASFFAPAFIRPLARAWTALGHLLGRITTPVLLVVVFVLVVIPVRALLTIFRIDPLKMRFDRNANRNELNSHWIMRSKRVFDKDDFERLS